MKIAILIITRGNRPELLKNCLRMVQAQTIQPHHIEIVDDTPASDAIDITYRYRIGYDRLRNKGFDIIGFMEDDDFYSTVYIETMVSNWIKMGTPDLFGINYTIYYNLKIKAWFEFKHNTRSSAMNIFIRPDLTFPWCDDTHPYTDMHLWSTIKRCIPFRPANDISIGIKHGTTVTGGHHHLDRLHHFNKNDDEQYSFLRSRMDDDSFNFYTNFLNK